MLIPSQKKILDPSKKNYFDIQLVFFLDPTISFISLHCNGDTICISQEIQCLPYAGFFCLIFKFKLVNSISL